MTPSFNTSEAHILQRALGHDIWLFECNLDKEPVVSWGDPRTHIRGVPEHPASAVYAVPCKGNGLVVVDIDTPIKSRQTEIAKQFPQTFSVVSGRDGGGYHLYFWDQNNVKNDVDEKHERGFDVKSGSGTSGGYVICPGSWHKSGRKHYRVLYDRKIVAITQAKIDKVKEFAERLKFEGEGRNNALYKHLYRERTIKGADDDAIEKEAREYNDRYFRPPLDERELSKLITSVQTVEPRIRGAYANDVSIYNDFIADNAPIIQYSGSFYVWLHTHWQYTSFQDISIKVQRYIQSREDILEKYRKGNLSTLINAVTSMVRRHSAEICYSDPFSHVDGTSKHINLLNGTWEFAPGADPEWIPRTFENEERLKGLYIDHCLPFSYEEDAEESPEFDAYIDSLIAQMHPKRVVPEGETNRTRDFLLEVMAYGVVPLRPWPYFLVMYGGEGTGKSSLPKILCEIVGEQAYVQRSMKHVIDGRFSMSDFLGKLIYVDDDLPDGTVIPGDFLKTLAGESISLVERKNKDPFSARLSVFPILLSNTRPNNTGAEGLRRRAIVIHLQEMFKSTPDLYLVHRISGKAKGSTDERPAIFNKLMSAWKRLSDRQFQFDLPEAVDSVKKAWVTEGDTISAWVEDNTDSDIEPRWQSGTEMYNNYKIWADNVGHRRMSRANFYARLESLGYKKAKKKDGQSFFGAWKEFGNTPF